MMLVIEIVGVWILLIFFKFLGVVVMVEQVFFIEQCVQFWCIFCVLVSNVGGGKVLISVMCVNEVVILCYFVDYQVEEMLVDVVFDVMVFFGLLIFVVWLVVQIGYEVVEVGSCMGVGINYGYVMDLVCKVGDVVGLIVDVLVDGKIMFVEDCDMVQVLNVGMKVFQDVL